MPTQIVTAFCEGPHDIAFLNRILKSIGFKSNNGCRIGKYPKPFSDLIEQETKKTSVSEINLTQLRRGLLPVETLVKSDTYFFLYSTEGKDQKPTRQRMLKELDGFIQKDDLEIIKMPQDTQLSVLYLFDADSDGISYRVKQINDELKEVFQEVTQDVISRNNSYSTILNIKIGVSIFTGPDNNNGTLEDVLIPLMREDNEPIFKNAETFLTENFDDSRLFPIKMKLDRGELIESRSTKAKDKLKFDKNKSLIGTVGQLQKSGMSNAVCIGQCDFISLKKIQKDSKCQEIIEFILKFLE